MKSKRRLRCFSWLVLLVFLCSFLFSGCGKSPKGEAVAYHYDYDKQGRIVSIATPGGKIKYDYNKEGMLAGLGAPGLKTRYKYDDKGNLVLMEDAAGKTEFHYDNLNRPEEVIYRHSPEKKVGYEYDPWNRITAIKVLNENNKVEYQVKYEYDLLGNLIGVDDRAGQIKYVYNHQEGNLVRFLPNGIKSIFTFTLRGELASLTHLNKNAGLIVSYQYKYDPAGRVVEIREVTPGSNEAGSLPWGGDFAGSDDVEARLIKYEWDQKGYLAALHYIPDNQVIHYQYDAMGNRISQEDGRGKTDFQYDGLGRLIKTGDTVCDYDKNGNLNNYKAPGKSLRLKYDGVGQLINLQSARQKSQYKYDGLGNLSSSKKKGEASHYLPDLFAPPGRILAEYNDHKNVFYTYGETLLACRDKGENKYYLEDGFSSIRQVVNQQGEVIGEADYSPFGEVISKEGEVPEFRTAGERYLSEAGLYLIGSRPYDPQAGCYLTPDPVPPELSQFDTFNRYAHGCRNPGIYMAPRCNQTSGARSNDFLNYINETSNTYTEDALITGWGSGGKSDRELLEQAEGRFGIIDVAGHPGGLPGDVPVTLLNDPSGKRWKAPYSAKNAWHHSRGNIVSVSCENRHQLDLSRLGGLPITDKTIQGIVSDSSSAEPDYDGGIWGIRFVGKSDNLLKAFTDAIGNMFRFGRGIVKLTGGMAISPITKEGPFASHSLHNLLERVPPEWDLPPKNSYNIVQIIRRNSDGTIREVTIYEYNEQKGTYAISEISQTVKDGTFKRNVKKRNPDEFVDIEQKIPFFPPPPPPPGGGGGAAGTGLLPPEPISSAEKELGGISLEAAAKLTGDFNLGNIKGVVWDEDKQCLVLLGEENTALPSLKVADLAAALKCVFDSGQDPQFSLDPADPQNPSGPDLKPVYYGPIENTSFGQAMFDADWKLKEYSFGIKQDQNGQKQEINSNVPGYKDIFDLSFEQEARTGESFMRFWITCDKAPLYQDGKSLCFGPVKMKVNTERMFQAARGELVSSGGQQDPVGEEFAAHFTRYYDEFAQEEPSFARVKELAKAVALAKWLKEQNIPVDMDWVEDCLAGARVNTSQQVPALSHTERKESSHTRGNVTTTQTLTLYLHGGVDLSVQPGYSGGNAETDALKGLVKEKLASSGSPVFNLAHGGQNLKGVVLPFNREGKSRWNQKEFLEKDGIKYYFTGPKVSKAVDDLGNSAEFTYDKNGRLSEIKWVLFGGIKNGGLEATAKKDISTLEVNTPGKDKILYCYGPSGQLNEIKLNEEKYATLKSEPDMLEVNYGNYLERFATNQNGQVISYQLGRKDQPETMRTLNLAYDGQGNLTVLFSPETGKVAFAYAGNKPAFMQLPGGEIKYAYDQQDRLKSVVSSWGKTVNYEYEGEHLKKILLTSANPAGESGQAYALFDQGQLIESVDFSGAKTNYAYTKGNLSQVTDAWGRKAGYEYDEKGQLQAVNLPSGGKIEYAYQKDRLTKVKLFPADNSSIAGQVSSKEIAVLLAEKRGRRITFKFDGQPEKTIANLERDLDVALEEIPGNREAAARRLQTALASVTGDSRPVLVWAPETSLGTKLVLFLAKEMGVRTILTKDPLRAAANLQKHRPLAGNASLVLLKDTFLKAQEESITREVAGLAFPRGRVVTSLQEVPAEDNTVVIVAENNPRDRELLREQLMSAGMAGRLQNKFIILQYCGEGKTGVAEEILNWGASGVFFYEHKVFVPAVGVVLREVDAALEANPALKADEAFRQAIWRALEKARENVTYKRLEPQLRDMLNHLTIALLEDEEKVG